MDFSGVRRRKTVKVEAESLSKVYPHDLQMYKIPPTQEIMLSEFDDLAIERLKVLRILEQATQKGHKPLSEDWKTCIHADLKKENIKRYPRLIGFSGISSEPDFQARRADHLSHFILRLAYCRSEELRRWFLNRELELFKLRFSLLSQQSLARFLKIYRLSYKPISEEEKQSIRDELIESTAGLLSTSFDTTDFYKVPFVDVCSLVKNRRVYLNKGFAYIPSSDLVVCVATAFRAHLSESLAYTSQALPSMDDDRISSLLNNIHTLYTHDYGYTEGDKDAVNIAHLDMYAQKHYPLCMRNLHEALRSKHHLKHHGRLQYGFFLKALGVTFEDAMNFWREEFTKIMDGNQFEKQYAYGIKHSYGKVGRMLSYSAHSCVKIITENVGPGEQHGCPFKHWDAAFLKQKLHEYGLQRDGIKEISDLCAKGHYQIACSKYFELTHGQPSTTVINHPNQYVEESMKIRKEEKGASGASSSGTVKKSFKPVPSTSTAE